MNFGSSFSVSEFVLSYLSFHLQIAQLIAQSLNFYPKRFPFLLSSFDLLLEYDAPLDSYIVF